MLVAEQYGQFPLVMMMMMTTMMIYICFIGTNDDKPNHFTQAKYKETGPYILERVL